MSPMPISGPCTKRKRDELSELEIKTILSEQIIMRIGIGEEGSEDKLLPLTWEDAKRVANLCVEMIKGRVNEDNEDKQATSGVGVGFAALYKIAPPEWSEKFHDTVSSGLEFLEEPYDEYYLAEDLAYGQHQMFKNDH